jgi:hypothetical protein
VEFCLARRSGHRVKNEEREILPSYSPLPFTINNASRGVARKNI